MADPLPIPGPPGLPLLGNMTDIDPANFLASFDRLADTYGDIFKLNIGGGTRIFVCTQALMNEICDEKRFTKAVSGGLNQIRNAVHDGLFTARMDEENWGIAHRTLVPAFGPLSIHGMFDEMHDIATQLVVKWARFGPSQKINVTDDFTRLTLDSIALCAMDTRFNSFYHDEMHPFVSAMTGMLAESGARAARPAIVTYFMRTAQKKYDEDIALLRKVAGEVVAERKAHPSEKKDLLNAMVKGKDPKTSRNLTDESIIDNMITFLVAGHETTSGLMSFLFYNLLKNPTAYRAAQEEVEKIVGRGPITVEHMSKLPYIEACLRETLRLTPTAPAVAIQPLPDTKEYPVFLGGGKYQLNKGDVMVALLTKIHRDPAVYGNDAEEFKPERMLEGAFAKLPPNSWKPFGNGMRGCIGRPFAWQEAVLSTALLLQNFDFRFDDPSYELSIKQTLTIKPKDFFMHATLRDHIDPVYLEKQLHVNTAGGGQSSEREKRIPKASVVTDKSKTPMTILYGSNSGTCEALAQSLARVGGSQGYEVRVDPLDAAVDKIPTGQPVIMISSSYEGQPPDNAAHFVAFLEGLKGEKQLKGVKYAVYGVGNRDWVSTFLKVPKGLDSSFEMNGATRIAEMGLGDVAGGDIFNDFDKWQDDIFWPAMGGTKEEDDDETGVEIEIDTASRRSTLRQNVREAIVLSNEVLTAPGEPEKRHITLNLPTGMEYKVGDYLAVLPINPEKTIRRVLKRFGLPWDAMLTIKAGSNTTLPTAHPISAMDLLGSYVELSQPATKRNIQRISTFIPEEKERDKLLRLAGPDFDAVTQARRLSPLDILEMYPTAALPFADFLAFAPPMRIRQYSISSSPLASPTTATLTWSVLDVPAKSALQSSISDKDGKGKVEKEKEKRFLGVASNYLAGVEAGDRVHVAVKPCHGLFHLPADIAATPVIMICAGSGIAPFRGFVQERALQKAAGRKLAPAYLFIGCTHPDRDALFRDEIKKWEEEGVVSVYYAFSRKKEDSRGCKYVQERLWEERDEMVRAFDEGAKIFICGSAMVGEGVAAAVKRIYMDRAEELGKEKSDEEVEEWFRRIRSDRYATDVFS